MVLKFTLHVYIWYGSHIYLAWHHFSIMMGLKSFQGGKMPEDIEMKRYGLVLNLLCIFFHYDWFKGTAGWDSDGFKAMEEPGDMEMERYGLEPISARYPISTLSPYIDTLVNKIRLAQKMTKNIKWQECKNLDLQHSCNFGLHLHRPQN